ncbi:MAG: DNA recombination/repair protein RecA, partial [Polyangiaceae bacterium]
GSPETTTGGNALKFYASVRLDIRRIGAIKESAAASDKKDPAVVGNRTRVKVVKNKMAPPFREVEFDILYGHGISRAGDIIDLASDMEIVEKSGAWFSYNGERIGQGRENAKAYLDAHPDLMDKLEAMILAKSGIKRMASPNAPAPAVEASEDKAAKRAAAPATPNGHAAKAADKAVQEKPAN